MADPKAPRRGKAEAQLATVTAEAEERHAKLVEVADKLQAERAAHEQTRKALEVANTAHADTHADAQRYFRALTSTRAELATALARVKELEAVLVVARAVAHLLDQGEMSDSLLETLANAVDIADGEDAEEETPPAQMCPHCKHAPCVWFNACAAAAALAATERMKQRKGTG